MAVVGHPDYEAEDVIGTLAARAPDTGCNRVGGPRPLPAGQGIPTSFVLYPKRGVSVVDVVDEAYIESRFGIPGRAYRDYAVLRGDSSDRPFPRAGRAGRVAPTRPSVGSSYRRRLVR